MDKDIFITFLFPLTLHEPMEVFKCLIIKKTIEVKYIYCKIEVKQRLTILNILQTVIFYLFLKHVDQKLPWLLYVKLSKRNHWYKNVCSVIWQLLAWSQSKLDTLHSLRPFYFKIVFVQSAILKYKLEPSDTILSVI